MARASLRVVLCVCILFAAAEKLSAHAELLSSAPAAGSLSPSSPSRVSITFSGAVDTTGDALRLFGPDGRPVVTGPVAARDGDPRTVETSVGSLAGGTYTVRWRVVSDDGHPINGTFQFSVGVSGSTAAPVEDEPPLNPVWAAAARAFHLTALALLVGPLAFLLAVRPAAPHVRQRLWSVAIVGSLLLIPAAAAMFVIQAAAVEGSLSSALRWPPDPALLATRWGALWIVRAASAVLALLFACWGRWRSHADPLDRHGKLAAFVAAVSAVSVTATALNGHAAATAPVWLSIVIDWTHLAATAAWLGGLAALAFGVFPVLRRMAPEYRDRELAPLASRFSTLALVCVELLILTGLYQAWVHVDAPGSLTSTSYGRALLVKLALFAAMLAPAAINLLVLRPRLQNATDTSDGRVYPAFRRTVAAELLMGAAILAVVGGLTSTQPARVEAASRRPPAAAAATAPIDDGLTLADHVGSTLVMFGVSPVQVGANRLQVELLDSGTGGAAHGGVRFHIVPPPDSGISPWTVIPAVEAGRYRASAALAPAGKWAVEVSIAESEEPNHAVFAFDVPARGARELLAASANRMNRLTSAVEEVETFADGTRSVATITYRTPDRQRWLQGDGTHGAEITIGSERFVGNHSGGWMRQPVPEFRWPAFQPHAAEDPVLIGRDTVNEVDCFVIAYVNPDDGSRHRAWIATDDLRMLRHSEAAPGRFVVNHFSRFDEPVQIVAPVARR